MNIYTVIGLAVAVGFAAFTLKEFNKTIAVQLSVAGGAVIMLILLSYISGLLDEMNAFVGRANIKSDFVQVMLKAVGVSYLAQIGSEICRDMGEGTLAVKVEIAGRVILCTIALPLVIKVMNEFMEVINSFL